MKLEKQIKYIFETYLRRPDDYDNGWKGICLDLQIISFNNPGLFSKNAACGFDYMSEVAYHTICIKCGDDKGFKWLEDFAKAWLAKTELPIFPHSCWFDEEEHIVFR